MKFEAFNKKYRNSRKDNIWRACQEAIIIMQNSLDPAHDIKHVENIFGLLDLFLSNQNNLRINFDILILAVCWHDTWKASNKHGGVVNLFYQQLVEGIASAQLFKKKSKKYSLSPIIVREVCYAIRKHSIFQILPIKTVEAKMLDDADKIDAFDYKRVENTRLEKIIYTKMLYIKIAIWYLGLKRPRLNYDQYNPLYNTYKTNFLNYLRVRLLQSN